MVSAVRIIRWFSKKLITQEHCIPHHCVVNKTIHNKTHGVVAACETECNGCNQHALAFAPHTLRFAAEEIPPLTRVCCSALHAPTDTACSTFMYSNGGSMCVYLLLFFRFAVWAARCAVHVIQPSRRRSAVCTCPLLLLTHTP